jgi:tetratricopeptide (TPR) repeat protein/transcriptional regulator with XRE-family HTH domain
LLVTHDEYDLPQAERKTLPMVIPVGVKIRSPGQRRKGAQTVSRSPFDPIEIPDEAWRREPTQRILQNRAAGPLFQFVQKYGISQTRLAAATGLSQGRINDLIKGRRGNITALDSWERIAEGLGMPTHARVALGLAPGSPVDMDLTPAQSIPADLGLGFPASTTDRADTTARLWKADLDQTSHVVKGGVDVQAWNDASLKWLLANTVEPSSSTGDHAGVADVQRVRLTTEMFTQMDNRFGGGHARHALIQFLATDVAQLMSGQFSDKIGEELFSSVAEATLLAAWMAYDSGLHGLAQRYFIQALALAESGRNRLLAGSILDAMSHQATFIGRYAEAANLARAAQVGTKTAATPTLSAHFHVMEARALARLGDARGCDLALSEAVKAFERRNPEEDPEWIRYFDDAELAAEFGHCFRDLGRPVDATTYATQSLGSADGTYQRSDFFATMVLADAHLRAGDAEEACQVALDALRLGEQLKSARCVSYVREFSASLDGIGPTPLVRDFTDQATEFALWKQTRPGTN